MTTRPAIDRREGVMAAMSRLARRQGAVEVETRLSRAAWLWLAALLGVVLFDAVWPMAPAVRLIAALGLIVGVGVCVYYVRPARRQTLRATAHYARRAERMLAIEHNALVNAVWLSGAAERGDASLTAALARRAVEAGHDAAERVNLDRAVARQRMWRQAWWLALLVIVWFGVTMFIPRLTLGGVARMFDPFGDHPPFSLTVFDVRVEPGASLEYGQGARVEVLLSGKAPQRVELVEIDAHGDALRRLTMRKHDGARAGGEHYERRFDALTRSLTFQIEADTGRSKRVRIEVAEPLPPPTDSAATTTNQGAAPTAADPVQAAAVNTSSLLDGLQRLADKAAELAARIDGLPPGQPLPDWLLDELKQLQDDIERITGRSRSLADMLRELAEQGRSATISRALLELAKRLDALKLAQLKKGDDARSLAQAGPRLRQMQIAAAEDAKALSGGLAQLGAQLGGTTAFGGSLRPPAVYVPDATGSHVERMHRPGTTTDNSTAQLQHVPETYRELVARYFDRLLRDQTKD